MKWMTEGEVEEEKKGGWNKEGGQGGEVGGEKASLENFGGEEGEVGGKEEVAGEGLE